ncbi:hypothetical protein [Rhodopseudomonas sp. BR0G17]|uniref:ParB/RepB/Spo0J family partition protein n=1 Tax=Rhodopseudomonas sp. BR0G17 TaxID=2269368 RepID=UPI0013DF0E73|nr:hypothetical protein [Rhodopseudomonas sp. BR0G17]NEW96945.1 hypothetical protein [Rhodopseudomonas sp. BR0G17]
MTLKTIPTATIDASGRLRELRPDWVDTFAADLEAGEELPPIEVVETTTGHRLLVGGHRLAAHLKLGRTEIVADVKDAASYPDDASCRMREIKENLVRAELTVLDRAVALAEWKRIYELQNPLPKRGRPTADELFAETAKIFVERFSAAAAKALGVSERSIYAAIEIASIDEAVRRELALHPIADNQAELLALARESTARQRKIAAHLLDAESGIASVADAVAAIDKTPPPDRAPAWEKVSNTFSKLKAAEQYAFFDAHADAIKAWMQSKKA